MNRTYIGGTSEVVRGHVYRNPLRWKNKHLAMKSRYGEEQTFRATIQNLSGKLHSYELQGLPTWMKASTLSGTIGAQDEETITFSISPYTNIGNFEEIIYMATNNPDDPNNPIYEWDCANEVIKINPTKMFRFYSNNNKMCYIAGNTDYLGSINTQPDGL